MTSPAVDTGIVAFIEARLDANEKLAREAMGYGYNSGLRLLAYVTAHRAILALHRPYGERGHLCNECMQDYPCQTVRLLAAIDADHASYRSEWKPEAT